MTTKKPCTTSSTRKRGPSSLPRERSPVAGGADVLLPSTAFTSRRKTSTSTPCSGLRRRANSCPDLSGASPDERRAALSASQTRAAAIVELPAHQKPQRHGELRQRRAPHS